MAFQSKKLRLGIAFGTMIWALAGVWMMLLPYRQTAVDPMIEAVAPVVALTGIVAFFMSTRRKLNR